MNRKFASFFLSLLFASFGNAFACVGVDVGIIVRDVKCNGEADGSITVRPTFISQDLPYLFSINGGSFSTDSIFRGLDAGSYSITVRNSLGCDTTLSETFLVSEPSLLLVAASAADVVCGSDGRAFPVVSGGIPPYLYRWSVGAGISIDTLRNLQAGSYTVLVEDQNGCSDIATTIVAGPPIFEVRIQPVSPTVAFGATIELSVQVNRSGGSYSYQWFPSDGLSCDNCSNPVATVFNDTEWRLFVTDIDNGCTDSDTIFATVDGKPTLYVPNAFSPNSDGRNDLFTLYGVGVKAYSLKVYDTRGFLVYDGDESSDGWDGSINGSPALEGVYYFLADVSFVDATRDRRKGQLTLIR